MRFLYGGFQSSGNSSSFSPSSLSVCPSSPSVPVVLVVALSPSSSSPRCVVVVVVVVGFPSFIPSGERVIGVSFLISKLAVPSAVRFAFFPMNRSSELSLFPFASSVGGIVVANCPFIFLISSSSSFFFFFFFFLFPKSELEISKPVTDRTKRRRRATLPERALLSSLSSLSPFVSSSSFSSSSVVVSSFERPPKEKKGPHRLLLLLEGLPFPLSFVIVRLWESLSSLFSPPLGSFASSFWVVSLTIKNFLPERPFFYLRVEKRRRRRRRRRREKKIEGGGGGGGGQIDFFFDSPKMVVMVAEDGPTTTTTTVSVSYASPSISIISLHSEPANAMDVQFWTALRDALESVNRIQRRARASFFRG